MHSDISYLIQGQNYIMNLKKSIWGSKGGQDLMSAMLNGTAKQESVVNPDVAQALRELHALNKANELLEKVMKKD